MALKVRQVAEPFNPIIAKEAEISKDFSAFFIRGVYKSEVLCYNKADRRITAAVKRHLIPHFERSPL